MPGLLVLADDPDWHTGRLVAACRARGAAVAVRALSDCAFVLDRAKGAGIGIPGFDGTLPDVVLVRSIATGSFQQVTFRLSILHALAMLGVPVLNDARAIERSVDKGMTSFLLRRAGLPTPPTWVVEKAEEAERLLGAADGELVLKPLFGSRGRGLVRLRPGDSVPPAEECDGVWYLQRFVGRAERWRDYRVFVVGGRAVAAMARHGQSWITNVARGGRCEEVVADGALGALGVAAAKTIGLEFGGIDIIEDEAGALQVLEVNSMPAWQGLQGVASVDIAAALVDHALARVA